MVPLVDNALAKYASGAIDRFTQYDPGYIEDALVSLDWTRGNEDVFEDGEKPVDRFRLTERAGQESLA